ncbi:MAG: hypothetical protein JXM69_07615 [Anaerolineae bacterium]|nr:hypothetical protein [Anaerolineae bacterium]
MVIDWMLLTYVIVGFFALLGFFRGWWKEAITTFLLAFLLLLLQRPDWAQAVVDFLNWIIASIWQLVVQLFGLTTTVPFQLDATSAGTWIMILILVLVFSIFISRLVLPSHAYRIPGQYYAVSIIGRVLGLLLGALNGFLVLSLVREYLDGRALPGGVAPETEITIAGGSAFGPAATSVSIQAVNLPTVTILDSYLPWLIIGLGLLIFFAALKTRVRLLRSSAGSKIEYASPYGYRPVAVERAKPARPAPEVPGPG